MNEALSLLSRRQHGFDRKPTPCCPGPSSLDDAYLDRWAPVLGIADLLARARDESSR